MTAVKHVPTMSLWRRDVVITVFRGTLNPTHSLTNGVGHINEVTLRRARLVLGWVTVFSGHTTSFFTKSPMATQPSTLSGMGNEY